jgi:hypothetical protein
MRTRRPFDAGGQERLHGPITLRKNWHTTCLGSRPALVTNTPRRQGILPDPSSPAVDVREEESISHPGEAALHSTFCSFPRLDTFFFLHILLVIFVGVYFHNVLTPAQHRVLGLCLYFYHDVLNVFFFLLFLLFIFILF